MEPVMIIVPVLLVVLIVFRQLAAAGFFGSYKKMFGTEYGSVIGKAFECNKKGERKFYHAVLLYNKKKYEEALSELKALEQYPGAGDMEKGAIYFFEALCTEDLKRKDEAVSLYEKAVACNPKIDRGWSNLGLLYKAVGEKEKAFRAYGKAIELNQSNPYAYNNMAQLLISENRPEEAIPYALRAYELRDWLYQAAMALAVAYARTGQPELAEQYYERCAELGKCDMEKLRAMMEKKEENNQVCIDKEQTEK